jgi:uncharacterized protein with WD repeat
MDIIATRGSFGDFGRVVRGQILKDVQRGHADKLIASGAFRQATAEDARTAEVRKNAGVLGAKAASLRSAKPATITAEEAEKIRQSADAAVATARKTAQDQVDAANAQAQGAKEALEAAKRAHADELAQVKADAAAQIAAVKDEAAKAAVDQVGASKK